MARRKKLEAPSAADLEALEVEFRGETSPRPMAPPIAQVAAETASMAPMAGAEDRVDAEALRRAREDGRLMVEIPLVEIDANSMVRDRMILDEQELMELRYSISANGQRLPVEVYELGEPDGERRFGLLSGYRRYLAIEALYELTGQAKYRTIRAVIKANEEASEAFAAMVEENEVRANLTPYERGRIAVVAAGQGAFSGVEEAVNALFASGSKAKRSKIRSFALVCEELGDLLRFPEGLSERQGLRLANVLRSGQERALRAALEATEPGSGTEEWEIMEPVILSAEAEPRPSRSAGRPRKAPPKSGWQGSDTLRLSSGFILRRDVDSQGYLIRIEGRKASPEIVEEAMEAIRRLLEDDGKG